MLLWTRTALGLTSTWIGHPLSAQRVSLYVFAQISGSWHAEGFALTNGFTTDILCTYYIIASGTQQLYRYDLDTTSAPERTNLLFFSANVQQPDYCLRESFLTSLTLEDSISWPIQASMDFSTYFMDICTYFTSISIQMSPKSTLSLLFAGRLNAGQLMFPPTQESQRGKCCVLISTDVLSFASFDFDFGDGQRARTWAKYPRYHKNTQNKWAQATHQLTP
ncbi:hypothetical protein B0H10DRAFT_1959165 [Mycena sp. CBHHK59/15]|nr:hypothetical protein B0H10DRAFT_1959165 [Mycena sp. CBHHK59/15]